MTVGDALDLLDQRIAAVEAALDAGEVPELPDLAPEPLDGPPTPAERRHFAASMQRLQACQDRLREHRALRLEELEGLDVRRRAATAYAREA